MNNALYYPYIEFHDDNWLKAMAMYYENIYRIVPNDIIPNDSESLKPLIENSSVGTKINPTPYVQETANLFLEKRQEWSAAALCDSDDDENEAVTTMLHADKIDQKVKHLFSSLSYEETDSWLDIPTELASNYMLFLAREIAKRNQLNLITPDWAPWTATTYFGLNGGVDEIDLYRSKNERYNDDRFALFSLIVNEIIPINISEIPAEKIAEFRLKRKDEIARFRIALSDVYDELQKLENPVVRTDCIKAKIDELKKAKDEYQKSAAFIKARRWNGISFMGFPAPIALGNLLGLPTGATIALGATSLAIGGIFNLKTTEAELRKLQKDNPVSLLVDMHNTFKHYTKKRGEGDINFHAYNCMEEYVND
jgi:hypothetical protein